MVGRADLCAVACEGLTDEELQVIVNTGGLKHWADTLDRVKRLQRITQMCTELPKTAADVRSDVLKMRPKLIEMLALMEDL